MVVFIPIHFFCFPPIITKLQLNKKIFLLEVAKYYLRFSANKKVVRDEFLYLYSIHILH